MSDIQATPFASCNDSKSKTPAQRAPTNPHPANALVSYALFDLQVGSGRPRLVSLRRSRGRNRRQQFSVGGQRTNPRPVFARDTT